MEYVVYGFILKKGESYEKNYRGGSSRLFAVAQAFLLISSCFMVSNLWTMESDEWKTEDGYHRAKLINKTGFKLFVVVWFFDNLTDLSKHEKFLYNIGDGHTIMIRVKNPKKEIGRVFIGSFGKEGRIFNASDVEEIEVSKSYVITGDKKWVPELKEK